MIWEDGKIYEGSYKKDKFHGQGRLKWFDEIEQEYTGMWVDGKMNGYGVFRWARQMKYEGEYVNGHKEGQGTFHWYDK